MFLVRLSKLELLLLLLSAALADALANLITYTITTARAYTPASAMAAVPAYAIAAVPAYAIANHEHT